MQGNAEVDKLFAFGNSVHSCHEEGKMVFYGFSDEKSLAYTSSSIDGDKLDLSEFIYSLSSLSSASLPISLCSISFVIFCAKI